jgi:hypothetical protein
MKDMNCSMLLREICISYNVEFLPVSSLFLFILQRVKKNSMVISYTKKYDWNFYYSRYY